MTYLWDGPVKFLTHTHLKPCSVVNLTCPVCENCPQEPVFLACLHTVCKKHVSDKCKGLYIT